MRGKNEGFTLVELVIVIAIIVVLTTLLVPSVIGYIRKAEVAGMNADAKQVHTAVTNAMAQLAVSHVQFNASTGFGGATGNRMAIASSDGNKINVLVVVGNRPISNNGNIYGLGLADKLDLVSYLGKGFNGSSVAYINPKTYSVDCLIYSKDHKTNPSELMFAGTPSISRARTHITDGSNNELVNGITVDVQEQDAIDGYLYGVYPQGSDSNSGS